MNRELLKALCIVAKANGCKWVAQNAKGWCIGYPSLTSPIVLDDTGWGYQNPKVDSSLTILSKVGYCDNWKESLVNVDEYLESER